MAVYSLIDGSEKLPHVCLVCMCVMYIDVYWVRTWVVAFLLKHHIPFSAGSNIQEKCNLYLQNYGLYRHISVRIVEFLSGVLSGDGKYSLSQCNG
jgi:hypothetical protein